jgi:hypothetical protein
MKLVSDVCSTCSRMINTNASLAEKSSTDYLSEKLLKVKALVQKIAEDDKVL